MPEGVDAVRELTALLRTYETHALKEAVGARWCPAARDTAVADDAAAAADIYVYIYIYIYIYKYTYIHTYI
jgi:hypothetical protein